MEETPARARADRYVIDAVCTEWTEITIINITMWKITNWKIKLRRIWVFSAIGVSVSFLPEDALMSLFRCLRNIRKTIARTSTTTPRPAPIYISFSEKDHVSVMKFHSRLCLSQTNIYTQPESCLLEVFVLIASFELDCGESLKIFVFPEIKKKKSIMLMWFLILPSLCCAAVVVLNFLPVMTACCEKEKVWDRQCCEILVYFSEKKMEQRSLSFKRGRITTS